MRLSDIPYGWLSITLITLSNVMIGSGVEAKIRPDRTIFSSYSGVYKPTLFTTQIATNPRTALVQLSEHRAASALRPSAVNEVLV